MEFYQSDTVVMFKPVRIISESQTILNSENDVNMNHNGGTFCSLWRNLY
jgi:hemin uptake protein HemP